MDLNRFGMTNSPEWRKRLGNPFIKYFPVIPKNHTARDSPEDGDFSTSFGSYKIVLHNVSFLASCVLNKDIMEHIY